MSHDSHHGGNPDLQHHFDSMGQQFDASKLGMWLFLAQEILFFGGLFCAYVIYRYNHPEMYEYGSHFLDPTWGGINTVVLLVSSLTMALAVRCAQTSNRGGLIINLVLTFACACGFMGIKYVEYKHKFEMGAVPGKHFDYEKLHAEIERQRAEEQAKKPAPAEQPTAFATANTELAISELPPAALGPSGFGAAAVVPDQGTDAAKHAAEDHGDDHGHHVHFPDEVDEADRPANLHIFFGIYFCMTGLHGLHVVGGMVMLIWLLWGAFKGRYHKDYFTPVDLGGLYWHLVDLVWIYLFPLLYLM